MIKDYLRQHLGEKGYRLLKFAHPSAVPYYLNRLHLRTVDLVDISDATIRDADLPPLDQNAPKSTPLSAEAAFWREHGYLLKRNFLPKDLLDAYIEVRQNVQETGWESPVPYMFVDEIKDIALYAPLRNLLNSLFQEEMCLSLGLTGYVSTERNWHQDDYLNPPEVNAWYVAVWIALDTIPDNCGPFQFVPGSHRWPLIRGEKVQRFMSPLDRGTRRWPKISEGILNGVFEREIEKKGAEVKTFTAEKGDLLIWHARLAHRGSVPTVKGTPRKALICHYTAASKALGRPIAQHPRGGRFLVVNDYPMQ